MSLEYTTFTYKLIEIEEGAQEARVVIDAMFGKSLDNLINDLTNKVGH